MTRGPFHVRAVTHDGAVYLRLEDLVGYVEAAAGQVPEDGRQLILSLLDRMAEAMEAPA